ncbi:hypothetical protein NZD89_16465 [Alicyclobacillus fastidiosus]|uniref:Glyoxalase-like domain-containing protein n=1 Tax=Alicyclobacillus fastidiosus TaxID=392011 RepID=A0ABY6ZAV3_9BACL|nr:hypothetical protein [Alicyclobacillus fastidiosus]WAH39987.1 hypothetical protein NZD89_16465 [Alicyclobacillus fastidiosus]GMA61278.1 hypothetical protein GCM10025859_17180 [Alicyclobacillus fastidiosus]
MKLAVDHIIQVVDDLQQVSRTLDSLDLQTVVHVDDRRAATVLHQCKNTYVEYCTPFTVLSNCCIPHFDSRGDDSYRPRTWIALGVDDIHSCAQLLRNEEYIVEGPIRQRLQLPTGDVVESVVLIPKLRSRSDIPLPIFMERVPSGVHALSVVPEQTRSVVSPDVSLRLRNIAIATHDVSTVVETWASMLGRRPTECWIQADIASYCVRIPLDDDVHIIFCSPVGEGIVADALREHGDQVFLLNFTGSADQVDRSICGTVYRLM